MRYDVGVGFMANLPIFRHFPWRFCLWVWAKASFEGGEMILGTDLLGRPFFRPRRLSPAAVAEVSNPGLGRWLGVVELELPKGGTLYLGALWNRKLVLNELRTLGFPVR